MLYSKVNRKTRKIASLVKCGGKSIVCTFTLKLHQEYELCTDDKR